MNTAGGVWAVKAFKSFSLGRHPSTVKLVGVLRLGVLSEIRDLDTFEDIIHSNDVPVGNTPKCSFKVRLG